MKRISKIVLLVVVALAGVLALSACNGSSTTVDQRWADNETLTYSVYDGSLNVGTATFVTTTKLTQEEKDAVSGADTKTVVTSVVNDTVTESVYYAHVYSVLTVKKTFTDNNDGKNNYVLEAEHDGKNYVYTLTYPNDADKNKSGKLNVGSSGYTDGEFLYMYVRCHDTSSLPSIKVADPFTDSVVSLSCKLVSSSASVATESALGSVSCNEILITRSTTPVGSGIYAYYLPSSEGTFGSGTVIKSSCFPVKFTENNMTYVLKDYVPAQRNA